MQEGHNVAVLTGGEQMTKAMQDEVLNRFRENKHKVLVTTDVLSRGIDVPNVSMVVSQRFACLAPIWIPPPLPRGVLYILSRFFPARRYFFSR